MHLLVTVAITKRVRAAQEAIICPEHAPDDLACGRGLDVYDAVSPIWRQETATVLDFDGLVPQHLRGFLHELTDVVKHIDFLGSGIQQQLHLYRAQALQIHTGLKPITGRRYQKLSVQPEIAVWCMPDSNNGWCHVLPRVMCPAPAPG